MASQVEISIPNTTTTGGSKPYTIYNISLRLPLRSFAIQKRYSNFTELHTSLSEVVGSAPPCTLPSKTWFANTVNKPELAEERRKKLEQYLQTINRIDDSRWRTTSVWRTFLDLPPVSSQHSAKAGALHSIIAGSGASITDPVVWLDCHRDLKVHLHDARLNLTTRDQASTPQKQHEASTAAKSSLVKAASALQLLESGLENIQKRSDNAWDSQKLGAGEMRRRKDLIAAAQKDKDGLENLLNAMLQKSKIDSAVASAQDKKDLIASAKPRTGRVIGRETKETQELDNEGVLQLQRQRMADQDSDVNVLRQNIIRQREMAQLINEELEYQNTILKDLDEDVVRVQGKIGVARKRIGKIS